MCDQELILAGVDVKDMMARFMDNEKLAKMIVTKFIQDQTYHQLCQAIAEGDMKGAEFACHTLKGITGNLSLKKLFDLFQEQLRLFRAGEAERAVAMMIPIGQTYEDALSHLKLWVAEN